MNFTKKHIICLVCCLMLVLSCAAAYANPTVTIVNKSGHPLYVYDFDQSNQTLQQSKELSTGVIGESCELPMYPRAKPQINAGHSIYFSPSPLNSFARGVQPDPFNPTNDGNTMFSFVEYDFEGPQYTIDVSYIDVFSYPITFKFSAAVQGNCEGPPFEYGPTSFSAIAQALKAQGSPWNDLIWQDPIPDPKNPQQYIPNNRGNFKWNKGIYRIVGLSKLWTYSPEPPPQVPNNYVTFYDTYKPNGTDLFHTTGNNNGWQTFTDTTNNGAILHTGYVKALHSVTKPDKNNKYGYYAFPKDDTKEVFANLPSTVHCTITVYPYDK